MWRTLLLIVILGCRKSDPDTLASEKPKKPKLARCVAEKKGKDLTIAPHCDVAWTTKFELGPGERLTIGAGSRVNFSAEGRIDALGGTIVARATAEEPITFASTEPGAAVTLDNADAVETNPTSAFAHVLFDRVSLVVRRNRARVELADLKFSGQKLALSIADAADIVSAKRLSFSKTDTDVEAPAAAIARIEDSTFAGSLRLNAVSVGNVTLPRAKTFVIGNLGVEDGTLTFPDGAVVRVQRAGSLSTTTRDGKSGALVASNVRFTSDADPPKAGDWSGLDLHAPGTKLDGCTIEHAGSGLHTAIRIFGDPGKTTIANTTFRNNLQEGIEAESCSAFEDAAQHNTAPAGTLCRIAAPVAVDSVGLLGVIGGQPAGGLNAPISFGHGSGAGTGGPGAGAGAGAASSRIVEKSASSTPGLPPEVIKRIVRANFLRLRACYDSARKTDPSLQGTVEVKFIISKTGEVTSAIATPGTLKSTSAATCIAGVLKTLSFPEPEGKIVSVSMTHEYSPP